MDHTIALILLVDFRGKTDFDKPRGLTVTLDYSEIIMIDF